MDEQTKHLVAAQLTTAYYVAAQSVLKKEERTEEAVVAKYQDFLRRLEDLGFGEGPGVLPEFGDAR